VALTSGGVISSNTPSPASPPQFATAGSDELLRLEAKVLEAGLLEATVLETAALETVVLERLLLETLLVDDANTELFAELFTAALRPALLNKELIEDLAKEFALDIFPLPPLPPPQALKIKVIAAAKNNSLVQKLFRFIELISFFKKKF
jgi:hypothetical protein